MIIEKSSLKQENYKNDEYYYNSAREGMFDLFDNMNENKLIDTIFLPGYIGWSPKEGSGIFDPINNLERINVEYYKMTSDLNIDIKDLENRINKLENKKFAVLIVNYFGFVDSKIVEIVEFIKRNSGWIVSDNAHGFFTHCSIGDDYSDATFFSLHKMFPFQNGGSLLINNNDLKQYEFKGNSIFESENNPWEYDILQISKDRLNNYKCLGELINDEKYLEYFSPLKTSIEEGNIPQTFPIIIKKGNRDKIYEMMNKAGYGVVSLYHTLIEPLQSSEYRESLDLSRSIINLPVHQDVDKSKYKDMMDLLLECCKKTSFSK